MNCLSRYAAKTIHSHLLQGREIYFGQLCLERRGGAERRGGRSHTTSRSAFRPIVLERPPRRSRSKTIARGFPSSCSRRGALLAETSPSIKQTVRT
jgi:hypothetical protein